MLIALAPEMHTTLVETVELLETMETFMHILGFETEKLNVVVEIIDGLLDRINGADI